MGALLAFVSLGVFAWAAVGIINPRVARLRGRLHAVGLLALSVALLGVGGAMTPEPSLEVLAERQAAAEDREAARAERAAEREAEQAAREAEKVSGVTFREINDLFGARSSMTELQKDRLWDRTYEGLCVEWSGELTSLDDGLFSGFVAQFRHLPTTLVSDVVMTAPNSSEDELMTWSIGTSYTYRATLDSYGALMGISASMGCD